MEERISFHDQISRNKLKSVFLILIVFVVLICLGYVIGLVAGPDYFIIIMIISIIFSLSYILISYYNSDKIALASVNAKPASETQYRQYHNVVEGLCLASGMPKPRLYIMENSEINAFASGRDPEHSVICVTTGSLNKLDKQELEGVIGHELSHIASYDIRFMTLVAVMVGMVSIISEIFLRSLWFKSGSRDDSKGNAIFMIIGILLAILAPIVVQLVQLSISRKREYSADASAVKFIRSPTGLTKALKKIRDEHVSTQEVKKINKAVAPLFISNPFKGAFSTHPPIEKRIAILERM
ncbi:MAG: M48 family metallopeptidase [Candidatus Pacearchaeota archaeon]|jgi:heat shock protein HtpX